MRRFLASPWLAWLLAAVVVAIVTVQLLPGLLNIPGGGPTPVPSPGASAGPSISTEPSFGRPTASPQPTFSSYVVRVGDSLTSIARAFSTTPRSIAWWNRGTYPTLDPTSEVYDPNRIEPGWTLVLIPGVTVDDASPPTASPAPATPMPGATVLPTLPPSGGLATVVSYGPRGTNQIALTFDMGGRLDPAVDIVTWLIDHRVRATLFPTGNAGTTTTEGQAVLALAAAHPELFDVGNHSWDHPDFTTLTAVQMAEQLTSTEAAIQPAVGQTTKPWFRPPFGAWNQDVRAGVGAAGWPYLVMWDIDTIDWKATSDGGPTAADIATRVLSKAQGGSIVLLHLGGWHTLEALPDILSGLQAKGLQPVTLAEMLGR
ncbi:MAG TPA: polysaccharide deacetylase family protein [Candidatus Eisenbacteria bacterium]|nr:polysaccharide deacetylase family protein [Candidatus Eisenbacteria bacterium]